MIVGLVNQNSGNIFLDDLDISKMYMHQRANLGIGYLPQDIELFADTVAANISRFRRYADDGEVIEAAKLAGVHDIVLRLPDADEGQVREEELDRC